jgi:F-type H+-transporting ATPase subunit b
VIDIDWTILLQFTSFIVLLLVLNAVLYRPLRSVIDRRREVVEVAATRVRELEGVIAEKMASYNEKLQEAKVRGASEKAVLRQEAAKQEATILGEAHRQAGEHLQAIKNRVSSEAEEARKGLRKDVELLAGQIASRVLGRGI